MKNNDLINRFISYVTIDTESDPTQNFRPSTKGQFDLLDKLEKELLELGATVEYDKVNGYIYSKLKATKGYENVKAVGFLAHVDTAHDISGHDVKPKIIENYNGEDIVLNEQYTLTVEENPEISNYIGKTLITTSGDTLLGCDDKGGITIIMEAIKHIIENNIDHGDICIGFTTDEEGGGGADDFDVDAFGADFAYTIDGGVIGELQFENFNASTLNIEVIGKNVHPGTAKDKMINALEIAMNFHNALPKNKRPEFTEGYEGFYLLLDFNGNVEKANLTYIVREHDKQKFNQMVEYANNTFENIIKAQAVDGTFTITGRYQNMREKVEEVFYIIDIAKEAMEKAQITPLIEPIRGGTDGSKLSFMGLPCPNIFTGGHNFHSRYEYVCVESMIKGKETVINIIDILKDKNL